jgi:hypothetical protein
MLTWSSHSRGGSVKVVGVMPMAPKTLQQQTDTFLGHCINLGV